SIAVNPVLSRAYVVRIGVGLSVIDTTTDTVIQTITVGSNPNFVAVNPSGNRVYVTNNNNPGTVSVINATNSNNILVATIPVGAGPWGVTFNPAGTFAYVTNAIGNNVSVIDTA